MQADLSTSIDRLADKLNIASGQFHGMMLQQARVEVYFDVVYLIIAVLSSIVSIVIFKKVLAYVRCEDNDCMIEDYEVKVAGGIVLGIVLFLIMLSIFLNGYDLITAWTNPEFWALKELLHK